MAALVVLGAAAAATACGLPTATTASVPCPDAELLRGGTLLVAATATSNEPRPAPSPAMEAAFAELAHRRDGCVGVLDPDDGTFAGHSLAPRRPDGSLDRSPNADRLVAANLAALRGAIGGLAARRPELDPVALVATAARRHPEPTTLYLVTSGLSSVGTLDLARLDWDDGGRRPGRWLVSEHFLPELVGWRVHLVGLGDVAGAQPPLDAPARARLHTLWLEVCEATQATCSVDEGGPVTAPTSTNRVTAVRPPTAPSYPEPVRLPGVTFFAQDGAELSPAADVVLKRICDTVLRLGLHVEILGRTDAVTGTAEHNRDLSVRRAQAVRDRLLALGLRSDAIVRVEGRGWRDASAAAERRDPGQVDRDRNVEIRFVASSGLTFGAGTTTGTTAGGRA